MVIRCCHIILIFLACVVGVYGDACGGVFVRGYGYERGIEHGNPKYDGRFRVNGPESVVSKFHKRHEIRENGMMQIAMPESLFDLQAVELEMEIWGGHPGTENKRVTVNGRSRYALPDETQFGHCTYSYPVVPLKLTDLTYGGRNALQFACDTGKTFWGIFIVDRATLNAIYKVDHPYLEEKGLAEFTAGIEVVVDDVAEVMQIGLKVDERFVDQIERVDFIGKYAGYDDNGRGSGAAWRGMSKWGQPYGIMGSASGERLEIEFDYSMLWPGEFGVKAVVHFKGTEGLAYRVNEVDGLRIPERNDGTVLRLIYPMDLPAPMWSRAGRVKECTMVIETDVSLIQRAQLHMKIWDGGAGEVEQPITFNGHAIDVTEHGKHDLIYKVVEIDPKWIKRANVVRVLSDTHHHGIEVIYPGPGLMIRRDHPVRKEGE